MSINIFLNIQQFAVFVLLLIALFSTASSQAVEARTEQAFKSYWKEIVTEASKKLTDDKIKTVLDSEAEDFDNALSNLINPLIEAINNNRSVVEVKANDLEVFKTRYQREITLVADASRLDYKEKKEVLEAEIITVS